MSILSPVVTGVMSPVLTGTESNTPFYRWVGAADGTRYIDLDNTITVDGYFKIELTWERKDRDIATGTGTTVLLGSDDEDDGVERLLANDSNQPTNPNRISFISDGTFRNFPNALDGVEQGQFIKIKLVKDENGLSLFIDGDLKGVNTGSINPFTIDKIGVRSDGLNASRGIIADLKITDYTKLPKGTYLLGDGTAYTQVNIPVVSGDVIEFDFIYTSTGVFQALFGFGIVANVLNITNTDIFDINETWITATANGVAITDGLAVNQGKVIHVVVTCLQTDTLTNIGSTGTPNRFFEGTIANFKVTKLDGSTYEYLTKDSVIDNGDGTAIAPQTGSVAEFGGELLSSGDVSLGTGWAIEGDELVYSGTTYGSCTFTNTLSTDSLYNILITASSGTFRDRFDRVSTDGVTESNRVFSYSGSTLVIQANGEPCRISLYSLRETTNGLIPTFNPANNLITYASNVVSYPIDEQDGAQISTLSEAEKTTSSDLLVPLSENISADKIYRVAFTYTNNASSPGVRLGSTTLGELGQLNNSVTGATFNETILVDYTITSDDLYITGAGSLCELSDISVREVNLDVLAYDENGGRYSTYDGEWTPDADHERVVFNQ